MVKTKVTPEDEWLHAFYYFNDEIPPKDNFKRTLKDYISFEFKMILDDKDYLFNEYSEYTDNTPLDKLEYNDIPELNEKTWSEFYIHDIFDNIQRGKRLIKARFIDGNMPFISSSAVKNGIDTFIGNTEKVRIFNNCLTLANSGSVGSTFYHPYTFVASDHVTHLKNENFDKYTYLFIASVIKQIAEKYNFNREISDNRLTREIIVLPIDNNGDPDYNYMKQYMINLEMDIMSKYNNFIEKKFN